MAEDGDEGGGTDGVERDGRADVDECQQTSDDKADHNGIEGNVPSRSDLCNEAGERKASITCLVVLRKISALYQQQSMPREIRTKAKVWRDTVATVEMQAS